MTNKEITALFTAIRRMVKTNDIDGINEILDVVLLPENKPEKTEKSESNEKTE